MMLIGILHLTGEKAEKSSRRRLARPPFLFKRCFGGRGRAELRVRGSTRAAFRQFGPLEFRPAALQRTSFGALNLEVDGRAQGRFRCTAPRWPLIFCACRSPPVYAIRLPLWPCLCEAVVSYFVTQCRSAGMARKRKRGQPFGGEKGSVL